VGAPPLGDAAKEENARALLDAPALSDIDALPEMVGDCEGRDVAVASGDCETDAVAVEVPVEVAPPRSDAQCEPLSDAVLLCDPTPPLLAVPIVEGVGAPVPLALPPNCETDAPLEAEGRAEELAGAVGDGCTVGDAEGEVAAVGDARPVGEGVDEGGADGVTPPPPLLVQL
jgi:hypothetical protein